MDAVGLLGHLCSAVGPPSYKIVPHHQRAAQVLGFDCIFISRRCSMLIRLHLPPSAHSCLPAWDWLTLCLFSLREAQRERESKRDALHSMLAAVSRHALMRCLIYLLPRTCILLSLCRLRPRAKGEHRWPLDSLHRQSVNFTNGAAVGMVESQTEQAASHQPAKEAKACLES